jgi:hypothetical protein
MLPIFDRVLMSGIDFGRSGSESTVYASLRRRRGGDPSEAPRRFDPKANVVEDRSMPRSAAPPARMPNGQRNSSVFQLNHARCSSATGITARGIGRVKNVTSAATRLIVPGFRETMSRRHKVATMPLVTASVECKNRSVNLEVTRPPSLVRGNFVYQ